MKDVTRKPDTLRTATAQAVLEAPAEYMRLLREQATEKGDALEAARIAAIMAAKRTSELIPHCHPLPLASVDVDFEFEDTRCEVIATVRLIAATGAEMEALTAASVGALTLYDMLKPHAGAHMTIGEIRLREKTGGKSEYRRRPAQDRHAVVIVLSDSVAAGRERDASGKHARERLQAAGFDVDPIIVLADEPEQLQAELRRQTKNAELVVTVGGTGIGPRDRTVEAVAPLLERQLPGLAETARAYGQRRMPYAMLSRAVAGIMGDTIVITAPGSVRGVDEYLEALLPGIVHGLEIMHGKHHSHGHG